MRSGSTGISRMNLMVGCVSRLDPAAEHARPLDEFERHTSG